MNWKDKRLWIGVLFVLVLILAGWWTWEQNKYRLMEEPETYTACGCGCCGGVEPEVKCLYRSKGDDIRKIIQADMEVAKAPYCPTVGCTKGVKFIYCDYEYCEKDEDCICCDGITIENRDYNGICVNKKFSEDCKLLAFPGAFASVNYPKCIDNKCVAVPREETTFEEIRSAPWEFDNEIVGIEIQNISLLGAAGTKLGGLACTGYGEMTYSVSDETEENFLCGPENLKLDMPAQIIARVHSTTVCKEFDDDLRTAIAECGEYYPKTSRDSEHWSFSLEYVSYDKP